MKRPREDNSDEDNDDYVRNIQDSDNKSDETNNVSAPLQEEFMSFNTEGAEEIETKQDENRLPPWVDNVWSPNVPPLIGLHNEILRFCDLISMSEPEKEARALAVDDVTKVLKSLWPNCNVKVFGSELTGLCLPSSDLDIGCLNISMAKVNGQSPLRRFAEELRNAGLVSQLEVVDSAKVPIVKLVHASTQVAADVSFNVEDGFSTGWLMREEMETYPQLRPLLLVLKYFLSQRGLNETFPSGGIGSFLLQLMALSLLQHRAKLTPTIDPRHANLNLGSLFVEFFDLYGRKFNYDLVGISVRRGGRYFRKRDVQFDGGPARNQGSLCMENPLNTRLDVGKNAFNIATSKRAMTHAHMVLVEALNKQHIFMQAQTQSTVDKQSPSSHSFSHPLSTNEMAAASNPPPPSVLATVIYADPVLLERTLPPRTSDGSLFSAHLPPPPQAQHDNEIVEISSDDDDASDAQFTGNNLNVASGNHNKSPKVLTKKQKRKETKAKKSAKKIKEKKQGSSNQSTSSSSRIVQLVMDGKPLRTSNVTTKKSGDDDDVPWYD